MLYVSLFTSDRERDPELWAVIWNGKAPPTLKLHGAYNLADNRRVFVWEGETVADLQFMDRFNHIGKLETSPAFDRTGGWQHAFAQDLDGFRENLLRRGAPEAAADRAIDLRRRGVQARGIEAAKRAAREWQAEQTDA
jgi:hypothetical protein